MSTLANTIPHVHTWGMTGLQTHGALLRRKREDMDLRLEDVADLIGRTTSFVHRTESGKNMTMPDPSTLRDFTRALGVSVEDQLRALGYLEADASETGPAYSIAPDDPRTRLLDLVTGLPEADIDAACRLLEVVLSSYVRRRGDVVHKGPNQPVTMPVERANLA